MCGHIQYRALIGDEAITVFRLGLRFDVLLPFFAMPEKPALVSSLFMIAVNLLAEVDDRTRTTLKSRLLRISMWSAFTAAGLGLVLILALFWEPIATGRYSLRAIDAFRVSGFIGTIFVCLALSRCIGILLDTFNLWGRKGEKTDGG